MTMKRGRKTARKDLSVPWTADETAELHRLREQGLTLRECALKMNRVEEIVEDRWRGLGSFKRPMLGGPAWSHPVKARARG